MQIRGRFDAFWLMYLLFTLLPLCMAGRGTSNARLTGVVEDSTSAPVPGASVTLLSVEGVQQTDTLQDGSFVFGDVSPGPYEVKAEIRGFFAGEALARYSRKHASGSNCDSPPGLYGDGRQGLRTRFSGELWSARSCEFASCGCRISFRRPCAHCKCRGHYPADR